MPPLQVLATALALTGSTVALPEGGPGRTTSVAGVAYAVGDTAAGAAILRLDVE